MCLRLVSFLINTISTRTTWLNILNNRSFTLFGNVSWIKDGDISGIRTTQKRLTFILMRDRKNVIQILPQFNLNCFCFFVNLALYPLQCRLGDLSRPLCAKCWIVQNYLVSFMIHSWLVLKYKYAGTSFYSAFQTNIHRTYFKEVSKLIIIMSNIIIAIIIIMMMTIITIIMKILKCRQYS